MAKMSQEEFEKSWEDVKYQLELEGFKVTEKNRENVRKVMMGEMSRKDLIKKYKQGN